MINRRYASATRNGNKPRNRTISRNQPAFSSIVPSKRLHKIKRSIRDIKLSLSKHGVLIAQLI